MPPTVTKDKVSDDSDGSNVENLADANAAFDQIGNDIGTFDTFAGDGFNSDFGGFGDFGGGGGGGGIHMEEFAMQNMV